MTQLASQTKRDQWIEDFGLGIIRYADNPQFIRLIERYPRRGREIDTIFNEAIAVDTEVEQLLGSELQIIPLLYHWKIWKKLPTVVQQTLLVLAADRDNNLEAILLYYTADRYKAIPEAIRLRVLRHPKVGLILQQNKDSWHDFPEQYVDLLLASPCPEDLLFFIAGKWTDPQFSNIPKDFADIIWQRNDGGFVAAALLHAGWEHLPKTMWPHIINSPETGGWIGEFSETAYNSLPADMQAIIFDLPHGPQIMTAYTPERWQAIPADQRDAVLHSNGADFIIELAEQFQQIPAELWSAAMQSPCPTEALENCVSSDLKSIPAPLQQLVIHQSNIDQKLWRILVNNPTLFTAIPETTIQKIIQHPFGADIIDSCSDTAVWHWLTETNVVDRCLEHPRVLNIIVACSEAWAADFSTPPDWDELFTRVKPDQALRDWLEMGECPDVPRGVDDIEEVQADAKTLLKDFRQHDTLNRVSDQEFFAVMNPVLLRRMLAPSDAAQQLVDRQLQRLRRIVQQPRELEQLPTIGYEIELPLLDADEDWYHDLADSCCFRRGADKAFEIASNVFQDGRIAALSIFSLIHSGLISRSSLQPAELTMHVSLGIPEALRGVFLHQSDVTTLQEILIPQHTSSQRIASREWQEAVRIHGPEDVSAGAPGRIELRVFDLHDQYIYRLLQQAPGYADMYFCQAAVDAGRDYRPDQGQRQERWRELSQGTTAVIEPHLAAQPRKRIGK